MPGRFSITSAATIQDCPRCGRQMFSCGCRFDEDGPDEDDDIIDFDDVLFFVDANGCPAERIVMDGQEVIVPNDDIPEKDVTTVSGIRCTTAPRTVIDIAPDEATSRSPATNLNAQVGPASRWVFCVPA